MPGIPWGTPVYSPQRTLPGWSVQPARDSGHNPDGARIVQSCAGSREQPIGAAFHSLLDADAHLRPRTEYGHVAAFAAWLAGYCLLLRSVLQSCPRQSARVTPEPPISFGMSFIFGKPS